MSIQEHLFQVTVGNFTCSICGKKEYTARANVVKYGDFICGNCFSIRRANEKLAEILSKKEEQAI